MKNLAACLVALAAAAPAFANAPVFDCAPQASVDQAAAKLGRDLFWDPILSGNRGVSCATCHHPDHATSDGVSLGIGDGGIGIGPDRRADPDDPPENRIPRNAPALFNLGADEFAVMFHDGRLEVDPSRPHGLRTPLGEDMFEAGLSPVAAQTVFPVLSADEMAGHYGENGVAKAVRRGVITGEGGAWSILAARIEAVPAYRAAFDEAFGAPVDFANLARALEAFMAFEWRADDSPFDRHICEGAPLPEDAARGMALFYGEAGCATCHAGRWQTDHDFHAIAMPQIGPGKAAAFEDHERDIGRMRVTGRTEDAYRFRTPSLRNVAKTGPYGHAGAYATLEAAVRHHLAPVASLRAYDPNEAILTPLAGADDFRLMRSDAEVDAIAAANELPPLALSDPKVADLLAFLRALTDETSLRGRLGAPVAVPSGLAMR